VGLWLQNRRRLKLASLDDDARLKLSPDEEARLEKLIAEQSPADKPQ